MKNNIFKYALTASTVLFVVALYAQGGPPPPPPPPGPPPPLAPIDGGAFALLIAGLTYGAKKLYGK